MQEKEKLPKLWSDSLAEFDEVKKWKCEIEMPKTLQHFTQ